jgi:hypothetical protein
LQDDEKRRAIREKIERVRQQRATKIADERARALEKVSAKEAARVKRETQGRGGKQDPGIMSWLGDAVKARATVDLDPQNSTPPPRSSQKLKAGKTPTLSMWQQNSDGSITGVISNSREYRPGTKITTSPIKGKASDDSIVTTISGSQYHLDRRKRKR